MTHPLLARYEITKPITTPGSLVRITTPTLAMAFELTEYGQHDVGDFKMKYASHAKVCNNYENLPNELTRPVLNWALTGSKERVQCDSRPDTP